MITAWMLEIAIRGLLAAAAGSLAALLLRRASASARALAWTGLLVGLLALPAANLALPRWELAVLAPPAATGIGNGGDLTPSTDHEPAPAARGTARRRPVTRNEASGPAAIPAVQPTSRPSALPFTEAAAGNAASPRATPSASSPTTTLPPAMPGAAAVLAVIWCAGTIGLLGRLLLGVAASRRLRDRAATLYDPSARRQLSALAGRAGLHRVPALLRSPSISVPVAIHLGRPAILVPEGFESWPPRQRAAVLLHEIAHLRRYDCWTQLLARVAVAIHWFNPLAWLAASQLWLERERACDDFVLLAGVRPSEYAGDLLAVAGGLRSRPLPAAVAFARPEHLSRRVRSILATDHGRRSPRWSTTMTVSALTLMVLLPAAAAWPVAAHPGTPAAPPAPATASTQSTPPAAAEPIAAIPAATAPQQQRPSIDELVKMRIHGVTPEFIDAMSQIARDIDVEALVKLRIHGVTPEYAQQMHDAFGRQLDLEELVQSRIHGVSPEYAGEMAQVLGQDLDFDTLQQMRIHGVQADLVRAARSSLGADVSADQVVKMRIHGISPEGISAIVSLLSYETLDVDDLVRMRIHGVDEEMIRELQQAGYDDLTVDELVKIKIHGMEEMMKRRTGGDR